MNDLVWWEEVLERHPRLYHVAPAERAEQILDAGLVPAGLLVPGSSAQGCQSRPGCVYLGSEQVWRDGWLHEWTGFKEAVTVVVETASLDPRLVWPDEDVFTWMTGPVLDPREFGIEPCGPDEDSGLWAARVHLGSQLGSMRAGWLERECLAYEGPIPHVELTSK